MQDDGATAFAGLCGLVGWGLLVVASIVFYFIPSFVAYYRNHRSGTAILLVNMLFGCTFIGWCIALIWSFADAGGPTVIVNQAPSQARCLSCGSYNVAVSPTGQRACMQCGNRG